MYIILYTYPGYDGEIDRIECFYPNDDVTQYLVFATRELAEEYYKLYNYSEKDGYEIVPITVVTNIADVT